MQPTHMERRDSQMNRVSSGPRGRRVGAENPDSDDCMQGPQFTRVNQGGIMPADQHEKMQDV